MTAVRARQSWVPLLLIVLVALGLRLYAIDRQDIWGDEAFSIWLSSQPLGSVVAGGADTHPPLYPFLLYLWLRLGGHSPLATRALSALIGTLTVPVVYVLACRVAGRRANPAPTLSPDVAAVDSTRAAPARRAGGALPLLAAVLAAISPVLVYYSQETRMYGLVTLLAGLSVYWALRFFEAPRSPVAAADWFLASLAAVYTHYYAFFVLLAESLVMLPGLLLRRRPPGARRWLALQAGLALAYVPWIAVQSGFLGDKASFRVGEWGLAAAARIAAEIATAFAGGLAVLPPLAWVVAVPFLLIAAAGLYLAVRRGRTAGWLLAAYLAVPLILAWVVDPIMPFFYARYLLLIAPAFYLLAAWGLAALLRRRWLPVGIAAVLLLVAGSGYGLGSYYAGAGPVKGRYGQMMAYVASHARPGDALLLANRLQRPIYEYYEPQDLPAYLLPSADYALEDPRTAADLAAIAGRHPRLWLVRFGNPAEYDPDGTLTRWLATHGSKAYFGGWSDADLALYVMTPAAEAGSIPNPVRVDLGGRVRLLGYALSAQEVAPGETLLLTLYWQALDPMAERYTVFTHLLDAGGVIRAQVDSEPQGGGLPTDRWTPGQVIQDNYALAVDPQAGAGPLVLEVGMYLLPAVERLPATDAASGASLGDRVVLATIEVVQP